MNRLVKIAFRNWSLVPIFLRPYFVKKVCFFGPESTGKSTMAKRMAEKFKTEFVPEVAREFITSNEFSIDDIVEIAKAQTRRVRAKARGANRILFCDTDLITTQIYSQHYLGVVPDQLRKLEHEVVYDLYFLFDIDVPWVADGLRDLGHMRREMFIRFKNALDTRNIKYHLVNGDWQQREDDITDVINSYLK